MALPDDYEKLAALTRKMLDAARVQDWDELTTIGNARDGLVAVLPKRLLPMPADDSARIAKAIKEVLACHTDIADRAGPWMEQTAKMLAAFEHANDVPSPSVQADTA